MLPAEILSTLQGSSQITPPPPPPRSTSGSPCPREESSMSIPVSPVDPSTLPVVEEVLRVFNRGAAISSLGCLWRQHPTELLIYIHCQFSQGCHTARQLSRLVVTPAEILAFKEQMQSICPKSATRSLSFVIRKSILFFNFISKN